jgi:hypothetical protein
LVFRQRNGRTIVSKTPTMSRVTDAQKEHRRRFQHAVLYSSAAVADPELNTAYTAKAKKGLVARNVAIADFFHAPDIETIELSPITASPAT